MSIESAQFCANWHIRNSEHFPKPTQFRDATQYVPAPVTTFAAIQYPKWLALVNQLFLVWMFGEIRNRKRNTFTAPVDFGPPIGIKQSLCTIPRNELLERRAACRRLAEDFEDMEREGDTSLTRDLLRQSFDIQMRLVDITNTRVAA